MLMGSFEVDELGERLRRHLGSPARTEAAQSGRLIQCEGRSSHFAEIRTEAAPIRVGGTREGFCQRSSVACGYLEEVLWPYLSRSSAS
jgi:hypothetical protein